jgi:bifunctional non-homologous end joining protein LigD
MSLQRYQSKRTRGKTPEPFGAERGQGARRFVVQKHAASHLHYDLRLEHRGVLKSWAVPKGPSLNPQDKRLAIMVEDHPLSYRHFEGVIPKGNYGAGTVVVWDEGTFTPIHGLDEGLRKGHIEFALSGKKLRGAFSLVRTNYGKQQNSWMLIKHHDEYATTRDVRDNAQSVKHEKYAPMLAKFSEHVPERKGWVYEVKWDGYRAIADVDGPYLDLYSRNGTSFVAQFPRIVEGLKRQTHRMVLDGEIVALNDQGAPRFQLLQNFLQTGEGAVVYVVFDALKIDGKDLRSLTLVERKRRLKRALKTSSVIRFSDHVRDGGAMWNFVQAQGLEGMMAKNGASPYRAGVRSEDWLKVKIRQRQRAVIGGFTRPRGSRKGFGALILGVYDGPVLRYIGHTGGGFTDEQIQNVLHRLRPLVRKTSPFAPVPKTNMPVIWVSPRIMCEVEFQEWTNDGRMRKPIFLALRSQPEARSPDKMFFPEDKIAKTDLVDYYRRISPVMLPYLKDRPESLNRYPNGIVGEHFYHKNITADVPPFVETRVIATESTEKEIRYLVCNNVETLEYMVNLGCIEVNPWLSRVQRLAYPDFMLMDLDPSPRTPFANVVMVAKSIHRLFDSLNVTHVCKTSGKRGLHICVPLGAEYTYDQSRQFAEIIARLAQARHPKISTIERSLKKRPPGVYIDYLQNRRGQTMVAPYSVRPVPGALVSTPLAWSEVAARLDPRKYTMKTIFRRLKTRGDLWMPVLGKGIDLAAALRKL